MAAQVVVVEHSIVLCYVIRHAVKKEMTDEHLFKQTAGINTSQGELNNVNPIKMCASLKECEVRCKTDSIFGPSQVLNHMVPVET